jgi:hypothetical protein
MIILLESDNETSPQNITALELSERIRDDKKSFNQNDEIFHAIRPKIGIN